MADRKTVKITKVIKNDICCSDCKSVKTLVGGNEDCPTFWKSYNLGVSIEKYIRYRDADLLDELEEEVYGKNVY